ncbi:MAG: hypothetical protein V1706_14900 [Pseudomonadota bacterium]
MSLKKNFLALLKDENGQNFIIDNAEVILDSALESDAIKAVPILGNLANIGKAYISFKDRQLINKIAKFLEQLKVVSPKELNDFLENDAQDPEALGEKVLVVLDRVETDEKAKIIGVLLVQYIRGIITKDDFDLLCHAVDRVYFFELHMLRHCHSNEHTMLDVGPLFLPFRITKQNLEIMKHDPMALFGGQKKPDHVKNTYQLTRLGETLVRILKEIYG